MESVNNVIMDARFDSPRRKAHNIGLEKMTTVADDMYTAMYTKIMCVVYSMTINIDLGCEQIDELHQFEHFVRSAGCRDTMKKKHGMFIESDLWFAVGDADYAQYPTEFIEYRELTEFNKWIDSHDIKRFKATIKLESSADCFRLSAILENLIDKWKAMKLEQKKASSVMFKLQCWQNAHDQYTQTFEASAGMIDADILHWAKHYAGDWVQMVLCISAHNIFDFTIDDIRNIGELLIILRDEKPSRRLNRHWAKIDMSGKVNLLDEPFQSCFKIMHNFGHSDHSTIENTLAKKLSKWKAYPPTTKTEQGNPVYLRELFINVRRKEELDNIEEMINLMLDIKEQLKSLPKND